VFIWPVDSFPLEKLSSRPHHPITVIRAQQSPHLNRTTLAQHQTKPFAATALRRTTTAAKHVLKNIKTKTQTDLRKKTS
jgi:hypothetical protein